MANKLVTMKSADGNNTYYPKTKTYRVVGRDGRFLDEIISDIYDLLNGGSVLTSDQKSALNYLVDHIEEVKTLVGLGISFDAKTDKLTIGGQTYDLKNGGTTTPDDEDDPIVSYSDLMITFGYAKSTAVSGGEVIAVNTFAVKQVATKRSGETVNLQYSSLQAAQKAGVNVSFSVIPLSRNYATVDSSTGALTVNSNSATLSRQITVQADVTMNGVDGARQATVTQSGAAVSGTVTTQVVIKQDVQYSYSVEETKAVNGVAQSPTRVVKGGHYNPLTYKVAMDVNQNGAPCIYIPEGNNTADRTVPCNVSVKLENNAYRTPNEYYINNCILSEFIPLTGEGGTRAKRISIKNASFRPQMFFFKTDDPNIQGGGFIKAVFNNEASISAEVGSRDLEDVEVPADANFVRLNIYMPSSYSQDKAHYTATIKFEK